MKLENILEECIDCYSEIDISGLAFDSRLATKGCLFFCLEGSKEDGHFFAEDAVSAGASVIVVSRLLSVNIPQIVVKNTRSALSVAAANFYGNPSKQMKMLGITGTNGKTTTSYILKSILEEYGEQVGIIGTSAVIYGCNKLDATLTTPDPIELNKILRDMVNFGITVVIMEVSAHALELNKVENIFFEVSAFTNLSRDHLDFFKNMDAYAEAKLQLFLPIKTKLAVVNIDDKLGRKIAKNAFTPIITYGCENPADAFAINLSMSVNGLEYILNINDDIGEVKFNLPGRFNMYNTLCAACMAKAIGVDIATIIKGIKSVKKVEGRFNIINTSKFSIIIDFAHTDDGLRNILNTIKEFADNHIITVFGCGGNRDKTKRPIMGKIASSLSDWCIVTSDNPRLENPEDIISEIIVGIKEVGKRNYCAVVDRKKAITIALKHAKLGDVVLIAGKGAEKYQDVMGIKEPYNDEEYIEKLIEENNL